MGRLSKRQLCLQAARSHIIHPGRKRAENPHDELQILEENPQPLLGPRGGHSRWTIWRQTKAQQWHSSPQYKELRTPASGILRPGGAAGASEMVLEDATASFATIEADLIQYEDYYSSSQEKWPLVPLGMKNIMLGSAISDLRTKLRSVRWCPPIHSKDYEWHRQVLGLLFAQQASPHVPRYILALQEARHATGRSGKHLAERIISHERTWILNRTIEESQQGCHAKVESLIGDENTTIAMEEYMIQAGKTACAAGLAEAIRLSWQACGYTASKATLSTLSTRTSQRWLHQKGYNWREIKKGVYKDGHERQDVLTYRQNVFLPTLQALESTFIHWELDSEEQETVIQFPVDLPVNTRPRIRLTHDECTFSSTDGVHQAWVRHDEVPFFHKGRGKGIMVSEYFTEIGNLRLSTNTPEDQWLQDEDGDSFRECTEIIYFEKGNYWTSERMVQQLRDLAIPLFEKEFPGCQAVFCFDNATNHSAYASDALRVKDLRLKAGGTQPKMRNGWNPSIQQPQQMQYADNTPKGMHTILEERGLWRPGLKAQCHIPHPRGKLGKNGKRKRVPNSECLTGGTCCARAVLADQSDFRAQRSEVEEVIEAAGHLVVFYPKFHCELNWIEFYWGACKYRARQECNYTFAGLKEVVPRVLQSVAEDSVLIWKYWARTERTLQAYRDGAMFGDAKYKEHVYKSHRQLNAGRQLQCRGPYVA